jgi:hypothetical protein
LSYGFPKSRSYKLLLIENNPFARMNVLTTNASTNNAQSIPNNRLVVPSTKESMKITATNMPINREKDCNRIRLFRSGYAVSNGNTHGNKPLSLKLSKFLKP